MQCDDRHASDGVVAYPGEVLSCKHLLLTVLGTNVEMTCYALGDRNAEAQLAPIALLDLLPQAEIPDHVLAVCTPEAKEKSWPELRRVLSAKCHVKLLEVSNGNVREDVNSYLAQLSETFTKYRNVDLTVDVTHGYRHLSFLTYMAVLYMAALRGVRVRGAYYGMLNRNGPSPFLNLRPLLKLPHWLHALEVLRDTGSAVPIAEILSDGPQGSFPRDIARELTQFSEAYLSGLPLELGWQARTVREKRLRPLRGLLRDDHHLPLAAEFVEQLAEILEPFALIEKPVSGGGWKRNVKLSESELKRQARIIDNLLLRENFATALGLMNEWTVSWVIWRQGHETEWLDYKPVRRRAGSLLGAIEAVGRDRELRDVLTEEQRSLADYWGRLSELRNAYAHHGMRRRDLGRDKTFVEDIHAVRCFWKGTLSSCPDFPLSLGESTGRVLVSPIGRSPGVLFSALHACRTDGNGGEPALCVVICSHETRGLVAEVSRRVGYTDAIATLCLKDPYGGRPEIERLVKAARRHFIGADDVFVNVTGGTTLMGLAAEALANEARKLACPVRRFGLIDCRLPQQQNADPYQTGEPFWLDAAEDDDASGD